MFQRLKNLTAASFALLLAVNVQATEWPYPEDAPKVVPVNIGMASDRPVDISRFL